MILVLDKPTVGDELLAAVKSANLTDIEDAVNAFGLGRQRVASLNTIVTISNTTSANDALGSSITLPGGLLGVSGIAILTVWGDAYNATAGSHNIAQTFKLGTTSTTTNTIAVNNDSVRHAWEHQFCIANQGAANSQYVGGYYGQIGTDNGVPMARTMAEDTATSLAITLNVAPAFADPNFQYRCGGAVLEYLTT